MPFGIDEMRPHVVLDDLGHQTGHSPSRSGDEMHDLFAPRLAVECALDGFNLASNAAHARQQLAFSMDSMRHPSEYSLDPYPMEVFGQK